jgi:hypothetical protein
MVFIILCTQMQVENVCQLTQSVFGDVLHLLMDPRLVLSTLFVKSTKNQFIRIGCKGTLKGEGKVRLRLMKL